MSEILFVPVQVRALFVKDKLKVSPPYLDMRRANSLDAQLTVREMDEIPNVSTAFIVSSLQLDADDETDLDVENLSELDAGVHLHWGVPDALSKMRTYPKDRHQRKFPSLPNRWLIVCQSGKEVVSRLYVESDFTYTEDSAWYQRVDPKHPLCQFPNSLEKFAALSREDFQHSTSGQGDPVPFHGLRAYHYIGRQIAFDDLAKPNLPAPVGDEGYLPLPLTVVGYGRPTFASVMSNCFNVFSAHHAIQPRQFQNGQEYIYDIIGWYSNPELDCLRHFHHEGIANPIDALRAIYQWEVKQAGDSGTLPQRSIYVGRVRVNSSEGLTRWDESKISATINCDLAVGNTGVEALAALTAKKLAREDEAVARKIEDQLEAFSFDSILQDKKQDVSALFDILRHEKGFKALHGGILWQVKPTSDTPSDEAIQLPAPITDRLFQLNELQRLYNRATGYIEAMRRQLYSLYVHYQYAAHASSPLQRWGQGLGISAAAKHYQRALIESMKHHNFELNSLYPEASHIWTYLQTQKILLQELDDRLNGSHHLQTGDIQAVIYRYISMVDQDILRLLQIEGGSLASIINHLIIQLQEACALYKMRVVPKEAPRFYKPNDPVILLHGADVPPITQLYGDDPNPLPCWVVDGKILGQHAKPETGLLFEQFEKLWEYVDQYFADANHLYPFDQHETHAEEAVELEWQADIYPILPNERNPYSMGYDYPKNYIHTNFSLMENASDLITHLENERLLETSVRTFDGRVILVPSANRQLQTNILNYLNRLTLLDFVHIYQSNQRGANETFDSTKIGSWWKQRPSPISPLSQTKPTGETSQASEAGVPSQVEPTPDAQPMSELEWRAWAQKQYLFEAAMFQADENGKLTIQPLIEWYRKLSQDFHDPIYTALEALHQLQNMGVLTQALGGLNEAMLMQNQILQLPFVDLVDFVPALRGKRDGRPYDDRIQAYRDLRQTIGLAAITNPEPYAFFVPIRTGILRLTRLHLLDSFGRVLNVNIDPPRQAHSMLYSHNTLASISPSVEGEATEPKESDLDHYIYLPPRLNQPAQLNFRWQSAKLSQTEADEQAQHGPICGWILPNMLERSLMVYDSDGGVLGYINSQAEWVPAPGVYPPVGVGQIRNPHLWRMVHFLTTDNVSKADPVGINQQQDFFSLFVDVLEASLENIDPENFAQHEALAILIGRPIALVRAAIEIRLQGLPAEHQSFAALSARLYGAPPPDNFSNNFESVEFPVRLGDHLQLNDGLVGYWIESANGREYEEGAFYAPNLPSDMALEHKGDAETDPKIPSLRTRPENNEPAHTLSISLSDPPRTLAMLVDPRGVVHATTGILPKKVIDIPSHLYVDALKKIAVTFLTSPILTDKEHVRVPMPEEFGYRWGWVQKESASQWLAFYPDATDEDPKLTQQSIEVNFAAQRIVEGWLRLIPRE